MSMFLIHKLIEIWTVFEFFKYIYTEQKMNIYKSFFTNDKGWWKNSLAKYFVYHIQQVIYFIIISNIDV